MKDTNLLVLVILFATTFGAYIFAYIFNFTNKQVKRQQPLMPPMPYPWPTSPRPEPKKENMSIWPMAMFMFICAILYLFYQYDGKALDFDREYANNGSRASLIESPHIRLPQEYYTTETPLTEAFQESVIDATVLANKSAKMVGLIMSQRAQEIYSPLNYDKGWGVKLVTKESSLRWIDEFEAQLNPFLENGRMLLINSVIVEDDVVLHRFYLGSFSTRKEAQSVLKYIKHIAPDANVVQLDQVDSLRPFHSAGA